MSIVFSTKFQKSVVCIRSKLAHEKAPAMVPFNRRGFWFVLHPHNYSLRPSVAGLSPWYSSVDSVECSTAPAFYRRPAGPTRFHCPPVIISLYIICRYLATSATFPHTGMVVVYIRIIWIWPKGYIFCRSATATDGSLISDTSKILGCC